MKNRKYYHKGFTLVELIVVIIIIAVFTAVVIPAVSRFRDSARRSRVFSEHRTLVYAIQTYIGVNEKKPTALDDLKPYIHNSDMGYNKVLATNGEVVAHTIDGTQLVSTFVSIDNKTTKKWEYDFSNVAH